MATIDRVALWKGDPAKTVGLIALLVAIPVAVLFAVAKGVESSIHFRIY